MDVQAVSTVRSISFESVGRDLPRNSSERLEEAVERINFELDSAIRQEDVEGALTHLKDEQVLADNKVECYFHEETGRYVVRIMDKNTDELIQQIPAQKILDYAQGLFEYLGIQVDVSI